MKIVINRCFGGFGLSPLAIRKYGTRRVDIPERTLQKKSLMYLENVRNLG